MLGIRVGLMFNTGLLILVLWRFPERIWIRFFMPCANEFKLCHSSLVIGTAFLTCRCQWLRFRLIFFAFTDSHNGQRWGSLSNSPIQEETYRRWTNARRCYFQAPPTTKASGLEGLRKLQVRSHHRASSLSSALFFVLLFYKAQEDQMRWMWTHLLTVFNF